MGNSSTIYIRVLVKRLIHIIHSGVLERPCIFWSNCESYGWKCWKRSDWVNLEAPIIKLSPSSSLSTQSIVRKLTLSVSERSVSCLIIISINTLTSLVYISWAVASSEYKSMANLRTELICSSFGITLHGSSTSNYITFVLKTATVFKPKILTVITLQQCDRHYSELNQGNVTL